MILLIIINFVAKYRTPYASALIVFVLFIGSRTLFKEFLI